jgi:hypothetical protein
VKAKVHAARTKTMVLAFFWLLESLYPQGQNCWRCIHFHSSCKEKAQFGPPPPPSPLTWQRQTLFLKLKKKLAGATMTPEEFKKEWDNSSGRTTKEESANVFTRQLEHCTSLLSCIVWF